ncbi:iron-containing alcohol dehydrogenase, partial [Paenibacillus sp. HJGM_3]|uniref:iron-containing alcohol dehydrogenase n=1 Tax=Paenibacillus sp. HJGM_3 TaxID=3379816 RepID=UPI00385E92E7
MLPFVFHNPTRLIFGDGQLAKLPGELAAYPGRVLLVYGGGSIKRSGLYDQVTAKLREAGAEWSELSGVEPNPRLSTVNQGIDICRQDDIRFILAVGGGSVIDCAKAIAIGAKFEGNVWDIIERKATGREALPLGTVLTLAATGSEMNTASVITNEATLEKLGWGSPLVAPKFSILDPAYTVTVPR